jgi:diguanylate cyclase (GGDEF)-like protein
MEPARDNSAIVYSAAAIYGGAALIGVVEGALPGGPSFSMAPSVGALVLTALILLVGRQLPRPALAALGPLGAAMIGFALATTYGQTDAAVFYMWPALWMAHFYGRAGTFFIVAWIGLVHGVAVAAMPDGGNVDRWIDVTGSVLVVAAVVRGLSARSELLVQRLKAEARVDPLTGLLNRRGLDERMGVEVARARRERGSLAAVALDLDHFKDVNDRHGHEVGDRVITWLGATIHEHVRGVDIAARLGCDEFAVVMVGAEEAEALSLAERIRAAVGGACDRDRFGIPAGLPITVSAGVAAQPAPADDGALLAAADAALYGAKRAGRDRAVLGCGDGAGRG